MFSNVLRNIDWKLLQQQKDSLTQLITKEKLPLNHPLVGLLGLVSGILIERVAGGNRVDVSMNYWWRSSPQEWELPSMCINFHSSLFSMNWATRMAVCSGLMISLLGTDCNDQGSLLSVPNQFGTEGPYPEWESKNDMETIMDMLSEITEKTILVRFGELEDRDVEE